MCRDCTTCKWFSLGCQEEPCKPCLDGYGDYYDGDKEADCKKCKFFVLDCGDEPCHSCLDGYDDYYEEALGDKEMA